MNILDGAVFRNITLTSGDFFVSDGGGAGGAVTDLSVSGLDLLGEDGGGRLRLGRNDRVASDSVFADVSLNAADVTAYAIDNRGDNNLFLALSTEGLNREGSAVPLMRDFGDGSSIDTLFVSGDANLSGTVDNRFGAAPTVTNVLIGDRTELTIRGDSSDDLLIGRETDETILGLGGNDDISGGDGDDSLQGRQGNDVLNGDAGHDRLSGGSGSDQLVGGLGDDIYILTDTRDTVVEAEGEGIDTIISFVDVTAAANVEVVALRGTAQTAIGNDLDNRFTGTEAANIFNGMGGSDLIDYADATLSVTVNLDAANGGGSGIEIGTDTLVSIENAIAGDGDDTVRGGRQDNSITLGGGDDVANGRQGDDTIRGGDGDDRLLGGSGDDALYGGAGDDLIYGGPGDDLMDGGAGDDFFKVDDLGDRVIEGVTGGHDTVQATVSGYALPDWVEDLYLGGNARSGEGNALANSLVGTGGNDSLNGRSGADVLMGEAGNDTLTGGWGNDRFVFEAGSGLDEITDFDAGAGTGDTLDLSALGIARTDVSVLQTADGAVVAFSAGNQVLLRDVDAASLAENDMIFAGDLPRLWLETSATERSGSAHISARLDRPADTDVEIVLNISGIGADSADMSLGTVALTIAAGQTHVETTVAVSDDSTAEADEDYRITASEATGAIDLSAAAVTGIIQDDDRWNDMTVDVQTIDVESGMRPIAITASGGFLLALQGEGRTVSMGVMDAAGAVTTIAPPPGWQNAFGVAISTDGAIAGYAYQTGETAKAPFIWRPDSSDNPGYEMLPLDHVVTPIITGMTTDGAVIGYDVEGALWQDGVSMAIAGQPRAINESSTVVGVDDSQPFIRTADGVVSRLDLMDGADAGGATALSEDGDLIAGIMAGDGFHWSRGFTQDANGTQSWIGVEGEYFDPLGIIADEVVVGRYRHFEEYDEYDRAVFDSGFALYSAERGLVTLDDMQLADVTEITHVSASGEMLAFSQSGREWLVLTLDTDLL